MNLKQLGTPGDGAGPRFPARLWLAFASMTGALIAGLAVAPLGRMVMVGVVAIVSSGLGSDGPLISADRVPTALRVLTGGFAAFATVALLLGTSTAIYVARRVSHAEDDASTPAIAFATVAAVLAAVAMFFLGPVWWRQHLSPAVVIGFIGAAALAGTIPIRTEAGVSRWVYGCLALIAAAPLGVEVAWHLQRPPRVVHSEPAVVPVVELRDVARATRFGVTLVAVAPDGVCYYTDGARLNARRPSGSDAWFHEPDDPNVRFARGAVGADGTLHVADGSRVYAFGAHGERRWVYDPGARAQPEILALGSDGTVYLSAKIGLRPSMVAINAEGAEKWRADVTAHAISVGRDGELFVAGTKVLSAYTADGRLEWKQDLDFNGQPAIGENGTLYLAGSQTLTALRPDGTRRWIAGISTVRQVNGRTPAIDAGGTVYVVNSNLWAVGADGVVKWQWELPVSTLHHAPLVAPDGTIVVNGFDGTVYGITQEGTVRWVHEQRAQIRALALAAAGAIYLAIDQAVVSIHPKAAAAAGPALWSEERHDAQNTSRAAR